MSIFEMAALLIAIVFAGGLLLYLHRAVNKLSRGFGTFAVTHQDGILDDDFLSALKPDFDARPEREENTRRRKCGFEDADIGNRCALRSGLEPQRDRAVPDRLEVCDRNYP